MKYEMMFPHQVRNAIEQSWPIVWPVGVLEYHSEHCVLGVDTLLVSCAFEELEKELDFILLPPFFYGSASYAVAGPEMKGTIHINSNVVHQFSFEFFRNLLRVGFRKIKVFIHHQSENFAAGMPTDLAIKLAARQSVFELLEKTQGESWWGDEKMKNYYSQHESGTDPFSWISVYPFMAPEIQQKYPIDHAGRQETSLMQAFCSEGVDMSKWTNRNWYSLDAEKADPGYGNAAKKMILENLRNILKHK